MMIWKSGIRNQKKILRIIKKNWENLEKTHKCKNVPKATSGLNKPKNSLFFARFGSRFRFEWGVFPK